MIVESGSVRRTAKLDLDELEVLRVESGSNPALKAATAVVFDMPEFGDSKQVGNGDFQAAIETVLREAKAGLRATVYSIYGSPHAGWPKGSASSMTGARFGQDLYHLLGGVNECTLEKYRQDEKGEWKKASSEDARHLKVIKTDNMGDIEIRKRTKPSGTLKWLRQLKEAFAGVPGDADVTVTIG